MSLKELVILHEGEEKRIPIEKERMIIGRDPKCEVILDDSSISRRHAVIICKFESVYIENISSTGRLQKGEEPVEYVEIQAEEEIHIGPFTLFWRHPVEKPRSSSPSAPMASQNFNDTNEGVEAAPSPAFEAKSFSINGATPEEEVKAISVENSNDVSLEAQAQENFQVVDQSSQGSQASLNGSTQIVLAKSALCGILKITKGELAGSEYRLEHGTTWTVGRNEKCQVYIDHPKLSRQHFQIVRIGNGFRVQDLNSAHGTRLNGVAISDAPLQAYDTLLASSLEFQFLIVDAQKLKEAPSGLALSSSTDAIQNPASGEKKPSSFAAEEKTHFAPPTVYRNEDYAQGPLSQKFSSMGSSKSPTAAKNSNSDETPFNQFMLWVEEQPTGRKALYGIGFLVLLATCLFLFLAPSKSPPPVASNELVPKIEAPQRVPSSAPTKPGETNAADARDVSPEFNVLSKEKQAQIKDLYARAERARAARDWQGAFDSAKGIFDMGIKRYKNAAEIMDEAQTYLNDGAIGNISKSISTLQEAQDEVKEKVKLLVENGEEALKEQRWSDASESFLKALNLDPNNERAAKGYASAQAKDVNFKSGGPVDIQVADEDFKEAQRDREELDGFRRIYQDVKSKLQNGNFREAMPHLQSLDKNVSARLDEYESDGRAPASYRQGLKQETKSLQSQVREAIETTQLQLRNEYAPQLADAEQLISNKQYSEARETYDRLLRSNPYFQEAIDSRERLYAKLLTEAKTLYHEALIYESVSDINNAIEGFKKSKDLLTNVNNPTAIEYFKKSLMKLRRLEP